MNELLFLPPSIDALEARIAHVRMLFTTERVSTWRNLNRVAWSRNLYCCIQDRRRLYAVMPHASANKAAYRQFFVLRVRPLLLHKSFPNIGADVAWLIAEYAYEPAQFVLSSK